jgi:hypothetical protein
LIVSIHLEIRTAPARPGERRAQRVQALHLVVAERLVSRRQLAQRGQLLGEVGHAVANDVLDSVGLRYPVYHSLEARDLLGQSPEACDFFAQSFHFVVVVFWGHWFLLDFKLRGLRW